MVTAAKILIVDDMVSNLRLLELALRRGGYDDVSCTSEPAEVASMHRENRYDLILLDLQMPAMSGFEVMKQLRLSDGEDRVSILVISADPSMMVPALEAGGNSFLSKPFKLPDVLERVQLVLDARVNSPRSEVRAPAEA